VDITVAICTWKRPALLRETLRSLTALTVPAGLRWELLIVNNSEPDETDAVAAMFAKTLPVRVAHERRPGIAQARNAALENASGSLLLWTDDDVQVEPAWLSTYVHYFSTLSADIVFGRVLPLWPDGQPPRWYGPKMAGMFAILDLDRPAGLVTDSGVMGFNVNLGMRTAAVRSIGGYAKRDNQGRLASEDDTDLFLRAHAAGLRIAYAPEAVVHHVIPPERTTKAFSRRRAWQGAKMHFDHLRRSYGAYPSVVGVPRFYVGEYLTSVPGYLRGVVTGDTSERFRHELRLRRLAGLLWNGLTARRQRAASPDATNTPAALDAVTSKGAS